MTQEIKFNYYDSQTTDATTSLPIAGPKELLQELEEGRHQGVIDWIQAGGSLHAKLDIYGSIAYFCFKRLDVDQIKEILSQLPEGADLPKDALCFMMEEDGCDKVRDLLPELERFDYSFDWIYQDVVDDGDFSTIEFFLTHPPKNLDLNRSLNNHFHITVHPLTQMYLLATHLSIWAKIADSNSEKSRKAIKNLERCHAIIEQMEMHPGIDPSIAHREIEELRQYFYFEGDPQWEQDCAFIVDARTKEGIKKWVDKGFDLTAPIGPFFIFCMGCADQDILWIQVLEFLFHYEEHELIDLMVYTS